MKPANNPQICIIRLALGSLCTSVAITALVIFNGMFYVYGMHVNNFQVQEHKPSQSDTLNAPLRYLHE